MEMTSHVAFQHPLHIFAVNGTDFMQTGFKERLPKIQRKCSNLKNH